MENSCGGSGPFEDCWNPSCKAEPFAGHGFLAALWRAVCACSCLKLQTFQAIRYCIWLCCPQMGTAPSTVEEPAPMEEQSSFWSSELARQYVLAMTQATQSGQTDWLRVCACCGQASYFRQTDSVYEATLSVEFHEDAAHGIGDCITVLGKTRCATRYT